MFSGFRRPVDGTLFVLGALAVAFALWHLLAATNTLRVTPTHVGSTPVTVFEPIGGRRAPVVVIAHGFAGSQQLMQPFAITLARNGYIAVTFDFLGHGQNPVPLPGGLKDQDASGKALLAELGAVVTYARGLTGGDGRLALLGHSMASDIVVRYGEAHADVDATVAVSLFSSGITADAPRNLLVIDGALEPAMLKDEALRVAGLANGGTARAGLTYGAFADGTARRAAFSEGVEHIGVLYSRESLSEALDWLNAAFNHQGSGFIDARGPWLGLLFAGLIALGRPLSLLLPDVAVRRIGYGLPWRKLLPVAVAPALLTPIILWKVPTDFLPLLLGDYITIHFALYGLLTAAGLWIVRPPAPLQKPHAAYGPLAVATIGLSLYAIVGIGVPIDWFVTSFVPSRARAVLVLAVLCGTLPYFVADEWLVRGTGAPRMAYAFTKVCFLVSIAIAIALNLQRLFFLIIIVPVILIFFIVYGLFSGWAYRRTRHPLVGALAIATALAWSIAVTFPIVEAG